MTRNKVAAKYVSMVDRVIDETRTLVPAYSVLTKVGQDIDLAIIPAPKPWFGGAMDEFDDRTLGDLVGHGLQGE